MLNSIIREAATRFNFGDKAPQFVRLLVDGIFDDSQGGFTGLQRRFQQAGLGDLFASWIGRTPEDNTLQPDQFNEAYGDSQVHSISNKLGVPPASVNLAGAWLLPKIIGLLTRDGVIPTARPANYDSWFAAPAAATATTASAPVAASGSNIWKWIIPLLLILAAIFLFRSCQKNNVETVAPATTTPAATQPATPPPAAEKLQPQFNFANTDGNVAISGRLATEDEKKRLVDRIKEVFGTDKVTGDITVDANTLPSNWVDKLIAAMPDLKANGLKFGFDGDKLNIDTSGLPEDQRLELSRKLRTAFTGFEISGLWDRAAAAFSQLKENFTANDLLGALNLMEVYFDTGSDRITADSADTLRQAANYIKRLPADSRIEIGGHTDNTGDATQNMDLSQRRATAVEKRLEELGVNADILTAKGYGQDKPKASNDTDDGRAQNCRIEFSAQ